MFLNKTMFKKWIKDAYNSGYLKVGMLYDGLVLSGRTWITWTETGAIPNWVKAAIIEFAGELPEEGELFKAGAKESLQYEIAENAYFDLPKVYQDSKVAFSVLPIEYEHGHTKCRLFQQNSTKWIYPVAASLYDIIDYKELENENRPSGPSSRSNDNGTYIWKNENSALLLLGYKWSDMAEDRVLNALSEIDFEEGKA